jgi:2-polyprenyl-3-methyl-5-hydroxy-6-metoxy-1,4-benzoquinol methylase
VDRWEQTRRPFVQAIHRSGDFMDIGCANGLLLESLILWAGREGFALRPHGLDFVPGLVDLARQRFPNDRDNFEVANAFDWSPTRQYDFVRTNLEYVPEPDWIPFILRQYAAVAPGGRLILSHYRNPDEPVVDLCEVIELAGFTATGQVDISGTAIVWVDAATAT